MLYHVYDAVPNLYFLVISCSKYFSCKPVIGLAILTTKELKKKISVIFNQLCFSLEVEFKIFNFILATLA